MAFITEIFNETWLLGAEMAPYLFLGFFIAGILKVFMPVGVVTRHLGGESPWAVIKASILGVPLPLCSCGVLPIAVQLRNSGAGKAPTLSFLITTPVTGVDSLLATYSLLGGIVMIARLVASTTIGILTGLVMSLLLWLQTGKLSKEEISAPKVEGGASCAVETASTGGAPKESRIEKARAIFSYAFGELPSTIAGSVLFGLFLGGVLAVVLPPEFIEEHIGTGLFGIALSIVVALPLYVCSAGAIPIAATMMIKGFSPGAALAFLIASPATNAVGIATVKKVLGNSALAVYISVIFAGAFLSGVFFDWLAPSILFSREAAHIHEHQEPFWFWIKAISGAALFAMLFYHFTKGLYLKLKTPSAVSLETSEAIELNVPAMTCNNCKAKITTILSGLPAVSAFAVNLEEKKVSVELTGETKIEKVIAALAEAGYNSIVIDQLKER